VPPGTVRGSIFDIGTAASINNQRRNIRRDRMVAVAKPAGAPTALKIVSEP
jgi:hypothetical protein